MNKADRYVLDEISNAKTFCAVMFLGRGRYLCERFQSLDEARRRAAKMTEENSAACSQRRAWVTAIGKHGASHPVPDDYTKDATTIGYVTALQRRSRVASANSRSAYTR